MINVMKTLLSSVLFLSTSMITAFCLIMIAITGIMAMALQSSRWGWISASLLGFTLILTLLTQFVITKVMRKDVVYDNSLLDGFYVDDTDTRDPADPDESDEDPAVSDVTAAVQTPTDNRLEESPRRSADPPETVPEPRPLRVWTS